MKIQLPLETWVDLLPLVPRRQLVEIVKQLGDRQFASILQFFFTEVGQITLGYLRIVAEYNYHYNPSHFVGPIVEVWRKERPLEFQSVWQTWQTPPPCDLKTLLPEGPMPTNVKDFKLIELSYFDMSVANFLRQFQQEEEGNSLLDNVNLSFSSFLSSYDNSTLMPIIAQLLPSISNINSIHIWGVNLMDSGIYGFEKDNQFSKVLTTILTKARILDINGPMSMLSVCKWLYTPRTDGKPRVLRLPLTFLNTINLIGHIKKDFSKAIRPVNFFVYVRAYGADDADWQDGFLDNARTNERLVIKTFYPPPPSVDMFGFRQSQFNTADAYTGTIKKMVLLSRYLMISNREWIEANAKEAMEWKFHEQNRRIRFNFEK